MRRIMQSERKIIGSLLVLQLGLWLGFLVHRSPRFPGSLTGGLLAVTGAVLMVLPPLVYSVAKRIAYLKPLITRRIPLGTLLSWHIYTSIIGAILAILHTGHRFESTLGIVLTAMMLLTILSGFIGRYFLGYASMELHEKQTLLNQLATQYNQMVSGGGQQPASDFQYAATHSLMGRVFNSVWGTTPAVLSSDTPLGVRAVRLTESIADVEYAIRTHDLLKRRVTRWLVLHIVTSCAFYGLLILHIWSSIYYGLRWFSGN